MPPIDPVYYSPPLVSIIMPTYNRAHMVGEAIDPVLSQTYQKWELIIVNDGSKDNTPEILDRYAQKDSRIKVFHKPNSGIGSTLNFGFAKSTGAYVTWTSDDNFYYPDAIETMVRELEEHPDLGMVYTDVRDVDAEGKELQVVEVPDEAHALETCVVRGCLLYRREVMLAVGEYRNEWTRCQDFDYYIRIAKKFKLKRIPRVVYGYRVHEASMTGNYEAIVIEEAQLLCHHEPDKSKHAAIWLARHLELARYFFNRAQFGLALKFKLKAACASRSALPGLGRFLKAWLFQIAPAPLRRGWKAINSNERSS